MKKLTIILALIAAVSAQATIEGFNEIVVSFTNPAEVVTNAVWSEPDKFLVSTNGLGWGVGETNKYRDFWIQSVPVAIGTSWRPARAANVTINADSQLSDSFFVRYSPDKKHWSSWQALNRLQGLIEVPRCESGEYDKQFSEYTKLAVPWRSDEEAAVKWILQRQPDFFAKQQPFIGYVQYRMEGTMRGDRTIKRIRMQLSWVVGGLHSIPQNPDDGKNRDGVWRFEAP